MNQATNEPDYLKQSAEKFMKVCKERAQEEERDYRLRNEQRRAELQAFEEDRASFMRGTIAALTGRQEPVKIGRTT